MSWLGIDIGTSALKVVVVADDGAVLQKSRVSYATAVTPLGRVAEQSPTDWTEGCGRALAAMDRRTRESIAGIGVVGQVPTLVSLTRDYEPVGAAITWLDSRGVSECAVLEQELGPLEPLIGTAMPWTESNPIAKLRWIADRDRERARQTRWIVQPKDYVACWLTGGLATDAWSSKGLCHAQTGIPVEPVLAAAHWDPQVLPPRRAPWEPVGALSAGISDRLGLRSSIPVAVGWSDACAGMLAIGAFTNEIPFILSGTSEIVGVSRAALTPVPGLMTIAASENILGVTYGPTNSCGPALDWLVQTLDITREALFELAAQAQGDVPVFLPFVRGERAPFWDDALRGSLSHISTEHGRAELCRSVLEGIAMTARHILTLTGSECEAVHLAPGALGPDEVALRLMTLNRTLAVHREREQTAVGAAILARTAAGDSLGDSVLGLAGSVEYVSPEQPDAAANDQAWTAFEAALIQANLRVSANG